MRLCAEKRRCQQTTPNSKNAFGKQPTNERVNSKLKPSEYSVPVLGLVFLLYADYKFGLVSQEIAAGSSRWRTGVRRITRHSCALYLPKTVRFDFLSTARKLRVNEHFESLSELKDVWATRCFVLQTMSQKIKNITSYCGFNWGLTGLDLLVV